jgi:hypothetical protein
MNYCIAVGCWVGRFWAGFWVTTCRHFSQACKVISILRHGAWHAGQLVKVVVFSCIVLNFAGDKLAFKI